MQPLLPNTFSVGLYFIYVGSPYFAWFRTSSNLFATKRRSQDIQNKSVKYRVCQSSQCSSSLQVRSFQNYSDHNDRLSEMNQVTKNEILAQVGKVLQFCQEIVSKLSSPTCCDHNTSEYVSMSNVSDILTNTFISNCDSE